MRALACLSILLLSACGGASSPTTGPSPLPSRVTVSGTITATISGAKVGTFSLEVDRLPTLIPVSAEGFVTRQAWVTSAQPTVDLIPEAGFDLGFYRQFARGSLDGPIQPIRRLTSSPSMYLQTAGLSPATVAAYEQAARVTIPAMTGGQLT